MTPEEILKKHIPNSPLSFTHAGSYEGILAAMEEYAKIQQLSFDEWGFYNCVIYDGPDDGWSINGTPMTHNEVWNEFLKYKQSNK